MNNERLGEIRNNKFGTPMKIIRYGSYDDIDVEFLDEHHYIKEHNTYSNFKTGGIKNPYDKTLFGVGYVGVGEHMTGFPKVGMTEEYHCWQNMLERCYCEKLKELHPAYYEISTVCEEWHNYQNFASWHKEHRYKINERLHLDKDILFAGNKEYSSSKCLLVPQRLNMMFMNKSNNRGLPNGIAKYKSGYLAKYGGKELGIFSTVEEAYIEQTKKKKEAIEELANEYKNIIPKEVYDAVMAYEFRIENDKNYRKCF